VANGAVISLAIRNEGFPKPSISLKSTSLSRAVKTKVNLSNTIGGFVVSKAFTISCGVIYRWVHLPSGWLGLGLSSAPVPLSKARQPFCF